MVLLPSASMVLLSGNVMFDEASSGKVKLFSYLFNKYTCCTVILL